MNRVAVRLCRSIALAAVVGGGVWVPLVRSQGPSQPTVQPGPNEPDWKDVLGKRFGLSLFGDLANPVRTTPEAVAGLFRKAGPGPVVYVPILALGLETTTRGGWYAPGDAPKAWKEAELWSYRFKHAGLDLDADTIPPPLLADGSRTTFDPGEAPFGLWVSNDNFPDGGVFSEPRVVAARNARLAKQPYKAMIYPVKDKATGKAVPNSYLIGWEYSTNDDFQDVVCRVENVKLLEK